VQADSLRYKLRQNHCDNLIAGKSSQQLELLLVQQRNSLQHPSCISRRTKGEIKNQTAVQPAIASESSPRDCTE
jgi:hypothetical protein